MLLDDLLSARESVAAAHWEVIMADQSHDYQADRGIGVGATEEEVVRIYGKGKSGNIDLVKGTTTNGSPVVIGKVGDKVLFYPGIQFVFAEGRVWAIILVMK